MDDGSLCVKIGEDACAAQLRVSELLTRSRAFLAEIDVALARVVETAGPRREALSCLSAFFKNADAGWQRAMLIECRAVHEFEFPRGVDYVCDAYNSDGRTLPLVDRVRGLMIGAHNRGLSFQWVASLASASDIVLEEALSSLSLVPEPSSGGSTRCSDSSESYVPDTVPSSTVVQVAASSPEPFVSADARRSIPSDAPVKIAAPLFAPTATAKSVKFDEPSYGWSETADFIEVIVTDERLNGVGAIPSDAVTCNFTESSFDLKVWLQLGRKFTAFATRFRPQVLGLRGYNFRVRLPMLSSSIIPSESK